MMFTKKFAATLMMLTQVSQAIPNSYKSIPQPATQTHLEPSIPSTPAFQIPPVSPEDPNYEQIKEFYDFIKKWFNIPDDSDSQPPIESPVPAPSPESAKPEELSPKPTEEPSKETPEDGKQPGTTDKFNPQVVLDLTNELRAQNGKKPLKLHPYLSQEAYKQSKYMESINDLTHDRPAGTEWGEGYSKAGLSGMIAENIAYGRLTDKEAVTAWSNSPGHRANMLGDFDYMGVAISGQFSTQEFARG